MSVVCSFRRKLKVFKEGLQADWKFSLGQPLLLLGQKTFLITEVRGFSKEVTQTFKWAHAGSLQIKLIDLQAYVALREHFGVTDPATFWLQTVSETVFPGLTKVTLYTLTMFSPS
ncbi:hypothetical protein N1851_026873 [Merluccius polli]|uniref:Uncharacterized protein n=1 Tax=Merluccius polli TaxID=89951 RepID=A0AA47NTM1_MERPO|nr:hypothetical protein N1851_026873 [Merluccius polli]